MTPNGLVVVISAATAGYGTKFSGSVYLATRYTINDLFGQMKRAGGKCEYEKLGRYGVVIESVDGAIFVHAKGNAKGEGCNNEPGFKIRTFCVSCFHLNLT